MSGSLIAMPAVRGQPLLASREYCAQITRAQARNFYYGLKLLPEPKRSAMFALYAYMRLVDDIADDQEHRSVQDRAEALDAWAEHTHAAIAGGRVNDDQPLWPAFVEMAHRYAVPSYVFDEVIAGQRQDLESPSFETFDQLREYCYRVAGVVGIASIHIWGFEGGADTENLAIDRGIAFQLTNILRDLREDAERGRLYLPRQEIIAASLNEDDLRAGRNGEVFDRFMRQQMERAESYYRSSAPLEMRVSEDSRPTLAAMTQIYHALLEKMILAPHRVLQERVSLSPLKKLHIAWRAARSR